MKDVTVQLQGCLRQFSGFPAVRSVLYLNSTQHHRLTTHISIDFGLELTSGVEFAEEEIDGRVFRRKFPWGQHPDAGAYLSDADAGTLGSSGYLL